MIGFLVDSFLIQGYNLLFSIQGCDVSEVQDMVESHLKDMILKYFDPKKADSIFTAAGQVTIYDLFTLLEKGN